MTVNWVNDEAAKIDGVEFLCRTTNRVESSPNRFFLAKRPDLVDRYSHLLMSSRPRTVVELGVFQGGSAAFAALVAQPSRMIAFERSPERIEALDDLVRSRGLDEQVRLHYGTDQADGDTVRELLAADGVGPERPIDLVVDDASHLVAASRASFEAIFPLLRAGGIYIVEDWAWAHVGLGLHLPDEQPLSTFVLELLFASASRPDVVRTVTVDRDWALVVKGNASVPSDGSFRLPSLYNGRSADAIALLENASAG